MSWGRIGSLIRHLPREANLPRALYGDELAWGDTEHLLANVVDLLQVANWQRTDTKKNKPPTPMPRPALARPKAEADDIARRLQAQRKRLTRR